MWSLMKCTPTVGCLAHVANNIRRLKRVVLSTRRTTVHLTSAIGNPTELAEKLIESPVLIDQDGSHGKAFSGIQPAAGE